MPLSLQKAIAIQLQIIYNDFSRIMRKEQVCLSIRRSGSGREMYAPRTFFY